MSFRFDLFFLYFIYIHIYIYIFTYFVRSLNFITLPIRNFFIMSEFRVFQYVHRQSSNSLEIVGRKKKQPNHFFLFSKELREHVPKEIRIPASKLNRFAGYLWKKKMTEEQREIWRTRSQREQLTPEEKELTDHVQKNAVRSYANQLSDCSYKEFVMTKSVLKNDCFLTDSLELNWSI